MKFTNSHIITIFALAVSLPLFLMGVTGHDAVNHLIISRLFADQFLAGDLYPRWLFDAEAGFGSPILFHFPALPYYVTLVFYPLRYVDELLKLPTGYLALYSTATLAIIASGIFTFKYLRLLTSEKPALLGALFYIAFPHHLIDLYYRFAFSELWALALIPLCLYFTERRSFVGLTFSFAALVLAHALSVIMFLPVIVALIIWKKDFRLLPAIALGIGLSAFYMLPANFNHDLVSLYMGVGEYDISKHFMGLSGGMNTYFLLAALPCVFVLALARKSFTDFWFMLAIGCLFMTTSLSAFVWEIFPVLGKLSFPWRFMTIATIAATILTTKIRDDFKPALIVLCLGLCIPALLAKNMEDPGRYLSRNILTIDDFRTKWTPQQFVVEDGFKKIEPQQFPDIEITRTNRELLVTSATSGMVTIPQFYFPNWQSDYTLSPQAETGLIELNLPKPGHFTISFGRNEQEILGIKISILSLLLIATHLMIIRKRKLRS